MASRPQKVDLDFESSAKITGLQTPTAPSDAATKAYVDAASGGGNLLQATLNFGASFTDKAVVVLTGLPWVTLSSVIVAQVVTPVGVDADEMRLLNMRVDISDLVAGVGFTVTLTTEQEAKGSYTVNIIGV